MSLLYISVNWMNIFRLPIFAPVKADAKTPFNHKEHKVGTKYTKVKYYISVLCELCVKPLRPLQLKDFIFL